MPTVETQSCEIHYEEHGEGFPLMLVSGLGGIGDYWQPQVETFSKHFRVITHDHRGTGRSSKSRIRYSLEQMAADTRGLMDALGLETAHLVGHSTGGAIAQILLVESPERLSRVVMYATWTKADAYFRRCFEVRRELLTKSGATAYVRATPLFLYPSWWIRDHEDDPELTPTAIYGSDIVDEIVESRIQALLDFDWSDRLGEINNAVLVLGVENDHLTPAYYSRELARRIPNAELAIMPDGGHAASQTMPEEFNRIVLAYIKCGPPRADAGPGSLAR